MIQFYSSDIESTGKLGAEESVHCARVLRKRCGDIIYVTDGKGCRYECRILDASTRGVTLEILSRTEVSKGWSHNITLAVAPTKNADRMSWLVEKAMEIGVDRIIFLKCEHSERKNINIDRLRRNAISAMNQSLKTHLPELQEMTSLENLLKESGQKFFGYCDSMEERVRFVDVFTGNEDIVICIGPEGDFSSREVKMMRENGFEAVTFGDERLRTETAALYGLCGAHILYDKIRN